MWMDIRIPIGMLFSLFGTILTLFGVFGGTARYEKSLGVNVNLIWGIVLLVFGIVMFFLGKRAKPPNTSPDDEFGDGGQQPNPRH